MALWEVKNRPWLERNQRNQNQRREVSFDAPIVIGVSTPRNPKRSIIAQLAIDGGLLKGKGNKAMEAVIFETYLMYVPQLEKAGKTLIGSCPWCEDDTFTIWDDGHFECRGPGCEAMGNYKDFVQRLGISRESPVEEEKVSEFGAGSGEGIPGDFAKTGDEDFPEAIAEIPESSNTRKTTPEGVNREEVTSFLRKLSEFILSGNEAIILVFLYLFPGEFEAREISQHTQIPQKNIHRVFAGLERISLISSTKERPRKYALSSRLRTDEVEENPNLLVEDDLTSSGGT